FFLIAPPRPTWRGVAIEVERVRRLSTRRRGRRRRRRSRCRLGLLRGRRGLIVQPEGRGDLCLNGRLEHGLAHGTADGQRLGAVRQAERPLARRAWNDRHLRAPSLHSVSGTTGKQLKTRY